MACEFSLESWGNVAQSSKAKIEYLSRSRYSPPWGEQAYGILQGEYLPTTIKIAWDAVSVSMSCFYILFCAQGASLILDQKLCEKFCQLIKDDS